MAAKFAVGATLSLSLVLALAATAGAQTVIYVDAAATAGAEDGSSWADAYADLQDALTDVSLSSGDEIWVAEGICKPTSGSDRTISFQLVAGVALYGGFAGTETLRGERDWTAHETIVSGDLLGDDDPAYPLDDPLRMNGENSYHVVVGADDARLDGFTVTAGKADGGGPYGAGGGMYDNGIAGVTVANCTFLDNAAVGGGGMANSLSSPTVNECIFWDNTADYGGGIYNGDSSPTVTGCMFWGNTATDSGGGMRNYGDSSPVVTDCMFLANDAYYGGGIDNYDYDCSPTVSDCTFSANAAFHGGGMRNDQSSPVLTDCTFAGNMADYGGAIYNIMVTAAEISRCVFQGNAARPSPYGFGGAIRNNESSLTVVDCEFSKNTATYGGAMANAVFSPDVLDCAFTDNTAGVYGGAMLNERSASPLVQRCSFVGNTAEYGGGVANAAISISAGSATIANCLFSANRALASSGEGGGIFHASDDPATVTNCTLVGNSAGAGGGIGCSGAADSCTVTSCILWDNRASTGPEAWGSSCVVSHSRISQTGGYTDAGGNIDLDPEFIYPGHWDDNGTPGDDSDDFWVDGDYHLKPGSPCIDRADGDAAPESDMDGNPRHDDPGMPNFGRGSPKYADMGAYEFQGHSRITPFAGGCTPRAGNLASLAFCLLVPCLALRRRRRLGYVPGMK